MAEPLLIKIYRNNKYKMLMTSLTKDCVSSNIRKIMLLLFAISSFNLLAQDRMTPARIWTNTLSRGYETSLINYFDIAEADNFACLVRPSFTGEYCLTYCKDTKSLKLKRAAKNIYSEQKWGYKDCSKKTQNKVVPSQEFLLVISDSLATSLSSMFTSIVLTSTNLQEKGLMMDGTTYQFIDWTGSRVAECHSPSKDTNCGLAVHVIEELCDAILSNDNEKAENLISEVVRTTNVFRQYYPAGFDDNNCW